MNKGIKIVLGLVSAIVLLVVGFTGGITYMMLYQTQTYEEETAAFEDEVLEDGASQDEEEADEPLAEESSEDEASQDEESDSVALADMDIDEVLAHFEKNEYPITWSVLWVVAPHIDADGTHEGAPVHANVQMPQEEQDFYMLTMPKSFERTVEEFTHGLVNIELTTVLYENPITYLETVENCLAPESFDEDMQASFSNYNSVICTARFNEPYDDTLTQDWLGLAFMMDEISYGFCQVASNMEYDDSTFKASELNPYEAEPWLHEWIHTLEPFCSGLGHTLPSPDGAESYGYVGKNPEGINGFYDYYYDIVNASVWDPSQEMYIGITPAMWKTMAYCYDQLHQFE